ncbi:MAG: GTPase, partial [Planctomycetota bacterium]
VAAISQQWSAGLSELACDPNATADAFRSAAGRFDVMRKLLSPPEVVLVGPPNVGKSTLANALVGRATSIVHETPGTTRDWVREQALLEGVPIWLTDTAGLFEFPDDPHGIDTEAVRRARSRAEQADLVLLLSAGDEPTDTPDWLHAKNILRVAAKCDLATPTGEFDVAVSAETGEGLDKLSRAILVALDLADINPAAPAAFTQLQADLLVAAAGALDAGDTSEARQQLQALLHGVADK